MPRPPDSRPASSPSTAQDAWSAVILTGGTARRLGGADKAALVVGGTTLLDRSLAAVEAAAEVVVVGPSRAVGQEAGREVLFVREEPAYGGPAAAVATGLAAVGTSVVVVLAVDLPYVCAATVDRLRLAAEGRDGSVLVDPDRRRQLAFVVRRAALAAVVPAETTGLALWRLLDPLDLAEVPARDDEAHDIDTWSDLPTAPSG